MYKPPFGVRLAEGAEQLHKEASAKLKSEMECLLILKAEFVIL